MQKVAEPDLKVAIQRKYSISYTPTWYIPRQVQADDQVIVVSFGSGDSPWPCTSDWLLACLLAYRADLTFALSTPVRLLK